MYTLYRIFTALDAIKCWSFQPKMMMVLNKSDLEVYLAKTIISMQIK